VQLYHYFVSQSSEFCCHNTLCCVPTSVYCCKRIFRYQFSPETFGYTLVHTMSLPNSEQCTSMWVLAFATPLKSHAASAGLSRQNSRSITAWFQGYVRYCTDSSRGAILFAMQTYKLCVVVYVDDISQNFISPFPMKQSIIFFHAWMDG
jgi:hypothetical protein